MDSMSTLKWIYLMCNGTLSSGVKPVSQKGNIYKSYQLRLVKWNRKLFSDLKGLKSVENRSRAVCYGFANSNRVGELQAQPHLICAVWDIRDYGLDAVSVKSSGCACFFGFDRICNKSKILVYVSKMVGHRKFKNNFAATNTQTLSNFGRCTAPASSVSV